MTDFQINDRVQFSTLRVIPVTGSDVLTDGTRVEVHGTVTRAMWGLRQAYCTVRTDDGRTFTRLAAELMAEVIPDVHIPDNAGAPVCLRAGLGAATSGNMESVTCRWCLTEVKYR